jgi:hypothetical protein
VCTKAAGRMRSRVSGQGRTLSLWRRGGGGGAGTVAASRLLLLGAMVAVAAGQGQCTVNPVVNPVTATMALPGSNTDPSGFNVRSAAQKHAHPHSSAPITGTTAATARPTRIFQRRSISAASLPPVSLSLPLSLLLSFHLVHNSSSTTPENPSLLFFNLKRGEVSGGGLQQIHSISQGCLGLNSLESSQGGQVVGGPAPITVTSDGQRDAMHVMTGAIVNVTITASWGGAYTGENITMFAYEEPGIPNGGVLAGPRCGASCNPVTRTFQWKPTKSQEGKTHSMCFVVHPKTASYAACTSAYRCILSSRTLHDYVLSACRVHLVLHLPGDSFFYVRKSHTRHSLFLGGESTCKLSYLNPEISI